MRCQFMFLSPFQQPQALHYDIFLTAISTLSKFLGMTMYSIGPLCGVSYVIMNVQ